MNNDIEQLKRDVAELKTWKEQRMLQQITYPLDTQSINALGKYFVSLIGSFITSGGVSGNAFRNIILKQDNSYSAIGTYIGMFPCTADSSTDVITLGSNLTTGASGSLPDDTFVIMFAPDPGDTPGGIDNGSGYFVVNSSGNTIKLSLTSGGAAINLTSNGTGQQYILY